MPGVFISYRREDSAGYTGRLFDILSTHFGRNNTYMDLDTIQGGDNFAAVIEQKINVSDVLVAVIGPHWTSITGEDGKKRLENPGDFVRLEIGEALKRRIRVIPVLVGGAALPGVQELPDELKPLCERQAVEIRDSHFHADTQQLIQVLHQALHGSRWTPQPGNLKRLAPALLILAAAIAGLLCIVLLRHSHMPARAAQVAGKWKATVKYDWGDTYNEVFDFETDGQELSGTASFLGGGRGDRGILDGKVNGNRLSFTTKSLATLNSDERPSEERHYYKGIVQGETIRFTMLTDSSIESHAPIYFTAVRMK